LDKSAIESYGTPQRVRGRKKAPEREVFLKELTLGASWHRNAAAGKDCHDFTKNHGVILGFRGLGCYVDTQTLKRFSQSRERTSA
jgi:hypothetical protein